MNIASYIVLLPVLAGLVLLVMPGSWKAVKSALTLLITLACACLLLFSSGTDPAGGLLPLLSGDLAAELGATRFDGLSRLILAGMGLMAFLIALYAVGSKKAELGRNFSAWFLLTLGFSFGAVMCTHLLSFLLCWGVLGITLYQLLPRKDDASSAAAKKALVMVGASDGIMILGMAMLWRLSGSLQMDELSVLTSDPLSAIACLCLLAGAFTKAGAFPLHSWLPDYAERAPSLSAAYLPASLDKLLGIYFLARICTGLFQFGPWMQLFLLITGVVTIITAVLMALVQHNYKRLLGFHAVSQVGYMILGFGLGSLIGVAAGLFHMLNNAIYKGGLFLSAGAVEQQSGKTELGELGGLSRAMPLTFAATLVFALSISGIPPFNGFASKWMIYQAIIDSGSGTSFVDQLWILWLACAVLGSALTLASFIKFTGGIFLGRKRKELGGIREVNAAMSIPMLVLALACLALGIWAGSFIEQTLIPATGPFSYSAGWKGTLVGIMVLVSILVGVLVYLAGNTRNFRTSDSFVGGESIQDELSYDTPEFYRSFTEFAWLKRMYRKAGQGAYDLYEQCERGASWLGRLFSRLHTGILNDYVIWVFAGAAILLIILIS